MPVDGVVRIGRIAEVAHTQQNDPGRFPVVLIAEMTHSAPLAEGTIVAGNTPESIDEDNRAHARACAAAAVGAFLRGGSLDAQRSQTATLLSPLLIAFVPQGGPWWPTGGIDEEHGPPPWATGRRRHSG